MDDFVFIVDDEQERKLGGLREERGRGEHSKEQPTRFFLFPNAF